MSPPFESSVRWLFRLSVIALTLMMVAKLSLDYVRPAIALSQAKDRYQAIAAACAQGQSATAFAEDLIPQLGAVHRDNLFKSLAIASVPCDTQAQQRERLLALRVSPHALAALELKAAYDPAYPAVDQWLMSENDLDASLRIIIRQWQLTPLQTKPYLRDAKFELGERLFHDPILSGRGDRSCATCHQVTRAAASGDAVEPRLNVGDAWRPEIPPRNVPDLWNRDHNDVTAMLWDGRVSVQDEGAGFTLDERLDTSGFENLMAVQSVRPLVSPVEMLGAPGVGNAYDQLEMHRQQPEIVLSAIARRLISSSSVLAEREKLYEQLLSASYGSEGREEPTPAILGNALAHYIEIEFQSRQTPWDRYLAGDMEALSSEAKSGAIVFYGVGGCAVCHSGSLFSDFDFHSVGVAHDDESKDLGRYYATGEEQDRYLFRTPPLRNVTLTPPYFHNGSGPSLRGAVLQHLQPLRRAGAYRKGGEHLMTLDEIEAVSPLLVRPRLVTDTQVSSIMEFLKSLEDGMAAR